MRLRVASPRRDVRLRFGDDPWAPLDAPAFELGFSFVGKLTGSGHARWAQKIVGMPTNLYDNPLCAVDAAGAVLVVDPYVRESALYVGKYAP